MVKRGKIRVLLADDHHLFRQGLRQLLELENDIEVVGEAGDGLEVQHVVAQVKPDIVLMDLNLPRVDGVSATREILQSNPDIGIIVLTMYQDENHVFQAVRAGARGYLLKSASAEEVIKSIRMVHAGASQLDPVMASKLLDEFRRSVSQTGEYARSLHSSLVAERESSQALHRGYVEAMSMLATLLDGRLSPEQLAAEILIHTKRIFHCRGACLFVYDRWEGKLTPQANLDLSQELVQGIGREASEALAGGELPLGQALTIPRQRVQASFTPQDSQDIEEIIAVPMPVGEAVAGILALAFAAQHKPNGNEGLLLVSLAGQVALLLRHASLHQALQELAVVEERRRIAREIHDGVAQNLAHLMLKSDLIQRLIDKEPRKALQEIIYCRAILEQSTQELRRTIQSLRPPLLTEGSLAGALHRLANQAAEQGQLEVHLQLPSQEQAMPPEAEVAVFRMVQEALHNVRKHAQANEVWITLRQNSQSAQLCIEDNGIGFDASQPPEANRYGLAQMRERAGSVGGKLNIESVPGQGTRVTVTIPLTG